MLLVEQALYGHSLAGAAFSDMVAEWLLANHWWRICDTGEQSLYGRVISLDGETSLVLLFLYTDDVGLSGPLVAAWVLLWEIHLRWGFAEKSITEPFARNLLGPELLRAPRQGTVRAFLPLPNLLR